MDSPQKQAGSTMDADCKTPVSVTVAKKAPASRPTLFPDAVRFVGIWALSTACLFLGSFTLSCALDNYYIPGDQCVEGDEWIWMMCAALQAAVAVLALLLPCRHRWVNRALAYLALAATIVGHYMLITSGVSLVLALNPERYLIYLFVKACCIATMVFLAAGDLVSILALLLALGGDQD